MFDFDKIFQSAKDFKFTKKYMLKINASFFDALGHIFPINLQGKLLFKIVMYRQE